MKSGRKTQETRRKEKKKNTLANRKPKGTETKRQNNNSNITTVIQNRGNWAWFTVWNQVNTKASKYAMQNVDDYYDDDEKLAMIIANAFSFFLTLSLFLFTLFLSFALLGFGLTLSSVRIWQPAKERFGFHWLYRVMARVQKAVTNDRYKLNHHKIFSLINRN